MSMKKYLNKDQIEESDSSSEMLLTQDKSKSSNIGIKVQNKQPRLYTVSDEYLLTIMRSQRESKQQIDDLKREMARIQKRLTECEDVNEKIVSKYSKRINTSVSSKTARKDEPSKRNMSVRKIKLGRSHQLYFCEQSNKTNKIYLKEIDGRQAKHLQLTEKKPKPCYHEHNEYNDLERSLSEYLVKSPKHSKNNNKQRQYLNHANLETAGNKNKKQDSNSNFGFIRTSSKSKEDLNGILKIKKLRKDFEELAALERRQRDIAQRKNRRREMIRLTKIIDDLEKTHSINNASSRRPYSRSSQHGLHFEK